MGIGRALVIVAIVLGSTSIVRAGPSLLYSQDKKHWLPLDAVFGRAKATSFYDYYNKSGHPAFGTEKSTASIAIYWDRKRSALSLIAIAGSNKKGDSGMLDLGITGLPWSTQLSLSDDPHEFDYDKGQKTTSARFIFKNNTDGLVFGGLERTTWVIKLTLNQIKGVKHWRLADGADSPDGDFIDLQMKRPLYLKMGSLPTKDVARPPTVTLPPTVTPARGGPGGGVVTTPVPEPGSAGLMLAMVGLLNWRRRR